MINDLWIKIIFLIYSLIVALVIGINSQLFRKKLRKEAIIILTLKECEVLENICMEVLGNRRWRVSRERALILNSVLDKLEEIKK